MVIAIVLILILIGHLFYVNKTLRDDIKALEDKIINDIVDIKLRLEEMPFVHTQEKDLASLIRQKRSKKDKSQ